MQPVPLLRATVRATVACALLAALLSIGSAASRADEIAGKAWTAYVEAQRQWQQELADFLLSHRPDLKDLIIASRDLQLAVIERRSLEFRYLLTAVPERIIKNQGIAHLANYRWTDDDSSDLTNANPNYTAAIRRIEVLRQKSEGNPHAPALRAANQALSQEAGYREIYQRFEKRVAAAEKLLDEAR